MTCYERGVTNAADPSPLPVWLTADEMCTLGAASSLLVPGCDASSYVDRLLGAFLFDPPRIWPRGPFSGRVGGDASFDEYLTMSPIEELGWRMRIEGTRGIPEREFNGPLAGWQELYRRNLKALGADYVDQPRQEQERRLQHETEVEFRRVLFEHACEAMYGAPEYGGNRELEGWSAIGFEGDVMPRGWSDDEVSGR